MSWPDRFEGYGCTPSQPVVDTSSIPLPKECVFKRYAGWKDHRHWWFVEARNDSYDTYKVESLDEWRVYQAVARANGLVVPELPQPLAVRCLLCKVIGFATATNFPGTSVMQLAPPEGWNLVHEPNKTNPLGFFCLCPEHFHGVP